MDQDSIGISLNLECERPHVHILCLLPCYCRESPVWHESSRRALDSTPSCLRRDITTAILPSIYCFIRIFLSTGSFPKMHKQYCDFCSLKMVPWPHLLCPLQLHFSSYLCSITAHGVVYICCLLLHLPIYQMSTHISLISASSIPLKQEKSPSYGEK